MIDSNILANKNVIVIIGLPGSGKTYLSNNIGKLGYIVHDDFISHFYDENLMQNIVNNIKVCINDSRLCIPSVFHRYMEIIVKSVNIENILLIAYENNPSKCICNIENRINKDRFTNSIYQYSKIYSKSTYQKMIQQIDYIELDIVTCPHT